MAVHFSLRDITFHASLTGVRIIATTDTPCHLWCRLSPKKPWIHRKPSLRRGIQFAEDVRFCFTVFKDNEQTEAGDTLTHTWWKENWPVCTTKYLYVWAQVGAEVAVSTSPLFHYHNDGIDPVIPPEAMYQLNSIDPQFFNLPGNPVWSLFDLSRDIPDGATGAVIQFLNTDLGFRQELAVRKPGANYDSWQYVGKGDTLWAIVGLDADRRFEFRTRAPPRIDGYVMGYTGRDVVFPDDPIDIKPTINNAYQTKDIKSTWPDAVILLTDLGSNRETNCIHSIRPSGSIKELFNGGYRSFPFCGVPASGNIQTKLFQSGDISTQWLAYAYIKQDCSFSLNGIDYVGFTANDWKTLDCSLLNPALRWAFLEYFHPFAAQHIGARKRYSYFNYLGDNDNHGYMIIRVHRNFECQVYSQITADHDQLLGIAETR